MVDSKVEIKKFIRCLSEQDYSQAHKHLETIVYDKTKKRCSEEYERLKNSIKNK